jgi:hypothetical protein
MTTAHLIGTGFVLAGMALLAAQVAAMDLARYAARLSNEFDGIIGRDEIVFQDYKP